MRIVAALAALLALMGCQQPKEITVSDGYVRLAATPRAPAVAYFTIPGGAADATLLSVSSDVSIRSEMHESMQSGSMASMKPIDHVRLPAATDLVFAPGGKHVMLFDMNPGIKRGATVPLLFTFADGQRIHYKAGAIGAGDPAPGK